MSKNKHQYRPGCVWRIKPADAGRERRTHLRDRVLGRERGQGKLIQSARSDDYTHVHREREQKKTQTTRPDCALMGNLIKRRTPIY